jgi:predicted dehydrogenase
MLETVNPHIISVASPDQTHHLLTRQCLEHPSVQAVLVEKPLAATALEATELEALAQQFGKIIIVNYSRRFCPIYQQLRRRIRAGEFGNLRLARGLYTKGMRHNGSHALDILRCFFPDLRLVSLKPPSWQSTPAKRDPDAEADIELLLEGQISGILHNLPFQDYTVFELDLLFENARLIFTDGGNTVEEHAVVNDLPFAGYSSLSLTARHEHALKDYLLHAARHLMSVMTNNEENISGTQDSIRLLDQYETHQPTKHR